MELSFYHVIEGNLVPSAVRLLEKIYNSGKRCIFYSPIDERVQVVDKMLWTFSTNAFIPHGDKSLGFSNQQPIYFTSELENPNQAKILVIVDDFDYLKWSQDFERVIFIFEEKSQAAVADNMFENLKNKKENVNYWKQSRAGWKKLS